MGAMSPGRRSRPNGRLASPRPVLRLAHAHLDDVLALRGGPADAHSSTLVSSSVPRELSPAALTRPSSRPKRASRVDDGGRRLRVGEVARDEERLGPRALELLADRLAAPGI